MHTHWSDGSGTVAEMATAANERGYEYIAITDHSKGLKIAGGIDEASLRAQGREIAAVNKSISRSGEKLTVLRSIEMNLNPRGEGDMNPRSLSGLDLVLGSFHSALRATSDQTERYVAALRNPHIQILGHPRGRIYNYRLGLNADWPRVFAEAPMENQIDRARLLADDGLKREFRAWLLDPINLVAFDRGIVLIPEKFLASGAIAPTPVGFDPSDLEPEFGLVQGEGAVFSEADIVAALKKAVESGVKLQNIRSPAGFERRLNDVTCSGCHQTRGIGGFHFPGVDWMADKPSNTTVVPASPHFFGDQIRRRDILVSLRDGKMPDYSRGFAGRPQLRGSTELAGTNYYDGWGAHCYVQGKPAVSDDGSFRDWTCAEGLTCQAAGKISRIGMCFVKSR